MVNSLTVIRAGKIVTDINSVCLHFVNKYEDNLTLKSEAYENAKSNNVPFVYRKRSI